MKQACPCEGRELHGAGVKKEKERSDGGRKDRGTRIKE